MGVNMKRSRTITIDGQRYAWWIRGWGRMDVMKLVVASIPAPHSRLVVHGSFGPPELRVSPRLVELWIRGAMKLGWAPGNHRHQMVVHEDDLPDVE